MGRILYKIYFIVVITLIFSCKNDKSFLPEMTGKPGEIVLVVNNSLWASNIGDSLKELFNQSVYGLPQDEAVFRVYRVTKSGFSNVIERHRSVMWVEIDSTSKSSLTVKKDVWAKGQMLLKINARNNKLLAQIISKNKEAILNYFIEEELKRLEVAQRKLSDKLIEKKIAEKHSININIPKGFYLAIDTIGFVWLKQELLKTQGGEVHDVLKNILIYYVPYRETKQVEQAYLLALRDSLSKIFIQGPVEGSYMKVYNPYPVLSNISTYKGMYLHSMRGLWNMEKYPMGGPFVTYVFIDEKNQRVVCIDAFLFCPNFDKRDLMREMEALLRSVSF
ncbi:MAG: DUF4837 family protein [Bacteroidia bacterium]